MVISVWFFQKSISKYHLCKGCSHWHIYIWTASSALKSVIKDGRNMRVFAHEVDCWPVFFVLFKSQRCSITLTFVIFRQPSWFSTDNAKFKRKYYEQAVQMYLCQWCSMLFLAEFLIAWKDWEGLENNIDRWGNGGGLFYVKTTS